MRRWRGIGLVAAMVLASLLGLDGAQGAPAEGKGLNSYLNPDINLGLTVSVDRKAGDFYLVGEPVYVTLHLTSFSTYGLNIVLNPYLQSGIHLEYRTVNTPPYPIKAPFVGLSPTSEGYIHLPHETRHFPIRLIYDVEDRRLLETMHEGRKVSHSLPYLLFDHQSFYRIWGSVNLTVNGVHSRGLKALVHAQIEVKVPEPGSADQLALAKMLSKKSRIEAMQIIQSTPEDLGFFIEMVAKYPKSRYTPHFLNVLGHSFSSRTHSERSKAMGYLSRLIEEYPDFPQIDAVTEDLARLQDAAKEGDQAYATLQGLIERNPGLMRLRARSLVIEKYYGDRGGEYHPMFWMLTP